MSEEMERTEDTMGATMGADSTTTTSMAEPGTTDGDIKHSLPSGELASLQIEENQTSDKKESDSHQESSTRSSELTVDEKYELCLSVGEECIQQDVRCIIIVALPL